MRAWARAAAIGGVLAGLPALRAPQAAGPQNRALEFLEGPDRAGWQQPERIMDELHIADGERIAEFMAATGWFTERLSGRVGPNGAVFAVESDPDMIAAIDRRIRQEALRNVTILSGEPAAVHLPSNLHAVLIVDAYARLRRPIDALRAAAASLGASGLVGVVDFTKDGAGGPGPDLNQRVDRQRVIDDAREAGLTLRRSPTFLRFEYLLVFGK